MGIPGIWLFSDMSEEELEKELVKTEKKISKLDDTRVKIKVALELKKSETSTQG